MTIMLVGRLLAAFLAGSLELTSWFTADTGTHFQYFRAVGLVLSDGNPVIVGCIEDRMPSDYNRLFTAREYDLDDPDKALWRCDYEDEAYGSLDDDGYAIVRYETEGDPPVEHFIAAGDTRVDLHYQLVPNDDHSAGLLPSVSTPTGTPNVLHWSSGAPGMTRLAEASPTSVIWASTATHMQPAGRTTP